MNPETPEITTFSDCLDALNTYGEAERAFGKKTGERKEPITEKDREEVRLAKVKALQKINAFAAIQERVGSDSGKTTENLDGNTAEKPDSPGDREKNP